MLRDPSPNDWPMHRLITMRILTARLSDQQGKCGQPDLEWVWNMQKGIEPAPLVYNGIVYLINPGNVIQALDGNTGELIWEHWTGHNRQDMRNIAMYDDKIIQATTDARLVALDAHRGTGMGNGHCGQQQGFSNSSGYRGDGVGDSGSRRLRALYP